MDISRPSHEVEAARKRKKKKGRQVEKQEKSSNCNTKIIQMILTSGNSCCRRIDDVLQPTIAFYGVKLFK